MIARTTLRRAVTSYGRSRAVGALAATLRATTAVMGAGVVLRAEGICLAGGAGLLAGGLVQGGPAVLVGVASAAALWGAGLAMAVLEAR